MNLDEIRKTYHRWAPFYNLTHRFSLPKRKQARFLLELKPGEKVLDLACGTGINLSHRRTMVGAGGRVVGFDLSSEMLKHAKKLINKYSWTNVELIEGDAANLPFQDASFDKVICSFSLNIIPEYICALEEINRVLVPGGRFVSLEMETHSGFMPNSFHVCGINANHDVKAAIRKVFKNTEFEEYWMKMVFTHPFHKFDVTSI